MPKGVLLILFAALIDGAQIAIGIAAVALGATAGTVLGAAGAYSACSSVVGEGIIAKGCALVGGLIGSIVQMFAAGITIPAMTITGMVLGVVVSIIGGAALSFGLGMEEMLYPSYMVPGFLGEVIPGIDWLPVWTMVTILSMLKKKAESGEGGLAGAVAKGVTAAAAATKGDTRGAIRNSTQLATQIRQKSLVQQNVSRGGGRTPLTDILPRNTATTNDDAPRNAA